MRALLFALVALCGVAFAGQKDDIFAKFDHAQHAKSLKRYDVPCIACHVIGAVGDGKQTPDALTQSYLVPGRNTCHECHAPGQGNIGSGEGATGAPSKCTTCHAEAKIPDSHGPGWLQMHGQEAAVSTVSCRDCHVRSFCADCHDRRDAASHRMHDSGWLTVHGIAARADPAMCDDCHVQTECTRCHASGAGYGRTP